MDQDREEFRSKLEETLQRVQPPQEVTQNITISDQRIELDRRYLALKEAVTLISKSYPAQGNHNGMLIDTMVCARRFNAFLETGDAE